MQVLSQTLSLKPFLPSPPLPLAPGMKFYLEIKIELVTQATIIIAIVAFSSSSLTTIAIYAQTPSASTFCTVILVVTVYLALCFSPC
jgi:hypothetical protein